MKPQCGDRFGRLVLVSEPYVATIKNTAAVRADFLCDCGTKKSIQFNNVVKGLTLSCGCLCRETNAAILYKHGLTDTRLHNIWCHIKGRCYNPKSPAYKDYGGRGIGMYEGWRNNFKAFYDYAIESGYKEGLQCDRRDNNKGYEPGNIRWTTSRVNNQNRRDNVWLTAFGETKVMAEWLRDERCVVIQATLCQRILRGWDHEKAITVPAAKRDQSWRKPKV